MSVRDEVLGRVRTALRGVDPAARAAEPPAPPQVVPAAGPAAHAALVDRFAERVADYRARVVRCGPDDDAAAVVAAQLAGASRVVVPPDLGLEVPGGVVDRADGALTALELDAVDAVVTRCRVAVAETGTIVLDHAADQGRRAITLVPDRHVCLVDAAQVVPDVADALARLDPARPLTWISGPSATSDIELERVEGVHGPRHLVVVITGPGPGPGSVDGGGVAAP